MPHRRRRLCIDQAAPPALPPFAEKTYLLGYQVFLENGKLQDAWLLASAAVQHRPEAMDWRERLAQTSEWTGRQPQALQHWLALARRTGSAAAGGFMTQGMREHRAFVLIAMINRRKRKHS